MLSENICGPRLGGILTVSHAFALGTLLFRTFHGLRQNSSLAEKLPNNIWGNNSVEHFIGGPLFPSTVTKNVKLY